MQFILGIDAGNTSVKCGLWNAKTSMRVFDFDSHKVTCCNDWIHYFSEGLDYYKTFPEEIAQIRVSSVNPLLNNDLQKACFQLFNQMPFFLNSTNCEPIKIRMDKPSSVGSDLIAGALEAYARYPQRNILIASFGTATTITVVLKGGIYAGAAFLPGFKLCRDSLANHTALLPKTEIQVPKYFLGKNTVDSIIAGIYAAQLGRVERIVQLFVRSHLLYPKPIIIGAGGFSNLLKNEKMFTQIIPNLVLEGLMRGEFKN